MTDIASHIRIFEASPTDEFVEKRQAAIDAIAEHFQSRTTLIEMLELAEELAVAAAPKERLPERLAMQVASALKNKSVSFVLEGHELEARVCALLGAIRYLEVRDDGDGATSRRGALALGLWSALSFRPRPTEAKLDKLYDELFSLACGVALKSAENSRQRVSDTTPLVASNGSIGEEEWSQLLEALNALRYNAALDREEIDVLWWVLADWSSIYQQKFSSMDRRLSPLVASWELAKVLKRVPAEAHKHLVLRLVRDSTKESLTDLVVKLGKKSSPLVQEITADAMVARHPHLFPLLNALGSPGVQISGSNEVRTPADWASRALLESSLLRVTTLPGQIA